MTTIKNKSLLKIIWSVIEQLQNYVVTDDEPWDEEFLIDMANGFRSALIKEQIEQTKMISDSCYQTVSCLEIKCRDLDCTSNGVVIPSGDKEYYIEIPRLIGGIGWKDIRFLGTHDYKTQFSRKNIFGFNTSDGDIYGRSGCVYTVVGNEVKIKNLPTKGMKYVGLIGLLDNPMTACDWDDDNEYPLPNFMVQKLETLMLKQVLAVSGVKRDYNNNNLPEGVQQQAQVQNNSNNE